MKSKLCKECGSIVYLDKEDIKERGGCICDDCMQRKDDDKEYVAWIVKDFLKEIEGQTNE